MATAVIADFAALALSLLAQVAHLVGNLKRYQMHGWIAIAETALAVVAWLVRDWITVGLGGSLAAIFAVLWWRGGGGDGTRRRLRKIRDLFRPVRRAAPAIN